MLPTLLSAAGALFGASACGGGGFGTNPEQPPNVVLILVDDLGYRDVGFMGATEIATPNLDRLAAEGVVFEAGYVAHPACTPSRAGLVTGRYPARYGMDGNLAYAPFDPHHGLPVEETTFVRPLRDAGYRTGLMGKWHLGAAPDFLPRVRGFEEFVGFLDGVHFYWGRDVDVGAPSEAARQPIIENTEPARLGGEEYLTDYLTDRAVEFVRRPAAPFFLYLSYNAPHRPLQAPRDLIAKYDEVPHERRRRYLAMVDSLDRNVGRLLDALEASGKREDTVVFFLSDNGGVHPERSGPTNDFADNGPLRNGKGSLYEGGIRVPFAASWPARWPRGTTYRPMVISLDIAATVLALAGVEPERPLDGVNLDPFLAGEAEGPPHDLLFWRNGTEYAVRSADRKLVQHGDDPPELFSLTDDLGESRNRLPEEAGRASELADRWSEWNRANVGPRIRSRGEYDRLLTAYLDERDRALTEATDSEECRIRAAVGAPPPAGPVGLRVVRRDNGVELRWRRASDPGAVLSWEYRFRQPGSGEWSGWQRVYGASGCLDRVRVTNAPGEGAVEVELRARNASGPGPAVRVASVP